MLAISFVCGANSKLITHFLDPLLCLLPAACQSPALLLLPQEPVLVLSCLLRSTAVAYMQIKFVNKQKGRVKLKISLVCVTVVCYMPLPGMTHRKLETCLLGAWSSNRAYVLC